MILILLVKIFIGYQLILMMTIILIICRLKHSSKSKSNNCIIWRKTIIIWSLLIYDQKNPIYKGSLEKVIG